MQQVHLRINDAATGQPTAVRLRITDAAGTYYAPFGRLTKFATGPNQDVGGNILLGGKAWAYIDGACEIDLPPGLIHVSIRKGPEYRPVDAEVELVPGKLSLRFAVERWSNVRGEGWHPGDTRVHFLTPHAALLEARAEDVALVQLLARATSVRDSFGQEQPAIPNLLAFSGQAPCLQTPDCVVAVNTENHHPELGQLGLLHCHRVVYPLAFGGSYGPDDWTFEDWCGQCHRKHGLAVWTRTAHESAHFPFGAPLASLLLGEIDAFELDHFEESPFDSLPLWYDLLNVGQRVPLAGASGKDGNGIAIGVMRTYVQLPPEEPLTCAAWIDGLRGGRSFVTNGPLLSFSVNGQPPGSVVSAKSAPLLVKATARSILPYEVLEIVRGGEVIATAPASGSDAAANVEIEVPVAVSTWLAARCRGATQVFSRPANQRVFAHTSPIYVEAAQALQPCPKALERLGRALDDMLAWGQRHAQCTSDHQRARLTASFEKAREALYKPSRIEK